MPVYDCGDPDCDECERAFGPDRSEAIRRYEARLRRQEDQNDHDRELTPKEKAMIDAAWRKHAAAGPNQ